MLALALAIGVAAAWGTADFLGGLTTRGLPVAVVIGISQFFGAVLVAIALAVTRPDVPPAAQLGWGVAAGILLAIGLAALYAGMARGVMSVVSPVSATGAAIPLVYGLARGERPSTLQLVGIAVALASVVIVARGTGGAATAPTARREGVGLALVAAGAFGLFFVAADLAADAGVLAATLAQRAGLLVLVAAVVAVTRPLVSVPRGRLAPLFAIGVLDTSATGMYVAATAEGLTSVVAVVASLYPAVTVLLAFVLLRERLTPSQRGGAAGALVGVCLMAAG